MYANQQMQGDGGVRQVWGLASGPPDPYLLLSQNPSFDSGSVTPLMGIFAFISV